MNKIKAKIKFLPNSFEVIEKGDYVICAVSKKIISLENKAKVNEPNIITEKKSLLDLNNFLFASF